MRNSLIDSYLISSIAIELQTQLCLRHGINQSSWLFCVVTICLLIMRISFLEERDEMSMAIVELGGEIELILPPFLRHSFTSRIKLCHRLTAQVPLFRRSASNVAWSPMFQGRILQRRGQAFDRL